MRVQTKAPIVAAWTAGYWKQRMRQIQKGGGGVSKKWTATILGTKESGAEELTGGTAAGGREIGKAISASEDEAGAGGRHGARSKVRDRVAGQQKNIAGNSSEVGGEEGGRAAYIVAGEPSGVGDEEGGRKSYGVTENLGGDSQGVQGGFELPQGIDTPGLDKFPWGDKTPGVASKGEGVTGEDGRG